MLTQAIAIDNTAGVCEGLLLAGLATTALTVDRHHLGVACVM